jgi:L-fucose isomerase-like protein
MQNELSIMPCATFGMLSDEFWPVACETDIKGAITSVMLQEAGMRRAATFFSDVTIRHPENKNANLLWHCGNFPASLARKDAKLKLSNHPLQEPHPAAVFEWEMQRGDITISRFDEDMSSYSLLIGKGKAVEGPKVNGTYVWLEVDNWAKWEHRMVTGPYIHHISGIYGDVTPVLYSCCKYIKGLKPDLLYPSEEDILNYLWDRE